MSPNYEYVFKRALSLSASKSPRVLDFGCGCGELLQLGRERNVEIFGVDRPGNVPSDRLKIIADSKVPFDDCYFDIVVSNQVFEHVVDPPQALAEISRVLKPGGRFLALFPDKSIWFEGHVGLYFVHRMSPRLAHLYMKLCHHLGFGYYTEGKTADAWADFMAHQLKTEVFYYTKRDLTSWWTQAFGSSPTSFEADYMRFRIAVSGTLGFLSQTVKRPGLTQLLAFICRKRAGLVWCVEKSNANG